MDSPGLPLWLQQLPGNQPGPGAEHHPIHRLLASNVNLCICTDDPGVFDITLASEIEWVLRHTDYTPESLAKRLGDPRRFALQNLTAV